MPRLIFHPDVATEIQASYTWYQEQAIGLGNDFISELEASLQTIIELPSTWPNFRKGFRRFF